jgi:WD40 repeat protein
VATSPDGRWLASAGNDKSIILWDASDGSRVRTLTGHTLNVWSIAFSPDSKSLVSGSFDHSVKLWHVDGSTPPQTFAGPAQAVVGVAFSPDGRFIAGCGDDAKVRLWRVTDGSVVRAIDTSPHHMYSVAFSPDGKYLAAGGRDHNVFGELLQNFFGDGAAGMGSTIRVYQTSDGALVQALVGHRNDVVHGLAFSPDGKLLASNSEDGTSILWKIQPQ